MAVGEEAKAHDPDVLAQVVWKAVTAKRPRPIYSVHADLRRTLLHRMPVRLADAALKRLLS
jgi:hypothetical protein